MQQQRDDILQQREPFETSRANTAIIATLIKLPIPSNSALSTSPPLIPPPPL